MRAWKLVGGIDGLAAEHKAALRPARRRGPTPRLVALHRRIASRLRTGTKVNVLPTDQRVGHKSAQSRCRHARARAPRDRQGQRLDEPAPRRQIPAARSVHAAVCRPPDDRHGRRRSSPRARSCQLAAALEREHESSADGRMAGKWQLQCRREDAHARGAAGGFRLEHEYGLRMAELACDRLHRRRRRARRRRTRPRADCPRSAAR